MKHLWIIPFLALTPALAGDGGLTLLQKRQANDPNNPSFLPPPSMSWSAPVDDSDAAYFFPVVPSEEQKKAALLLAYKINGNSMVGNNVMVDLTKPIPIEAVRVPVTEVQKAMPVRVAEVSDVCTRHGKRKISIRGGKSWRCK